MNRPVGKGIVAILVLWPMLAVGFTITYAEQPTIEVDLASVNLNAKAFQRAAGSVGTGSFGLPVAAGADCDGDGLPDTAFASMLASPLDRTSAGIVYLVFGNGKIKGQIDTFVPSKEVLQIHGDGKFEISGNEIWMADVTGDGIGDLLIGRQNFSPDAERMGAGALSIVVGGAALRDLATALKPLDLRSLPSSVVVTTLIGAAAFDRLGIWMRTGDVTGDGIADLVVGADQASSEVEQHHGVAYVVRGGSHLASGQRIDLADFGNTTIHGHLARLVPPEGSAHNHLGATSEIADLDGNGKAEVLVAVALDRAGASLRADGAPSNQAHESGGAPNGRFYIVWDDNFDQNPWPSGFTIDVTDGPGSHSILRGGALNRRFGEEILGGLDYDHNGRSDLFIGDPFGSVSRLGRTASGSGHIIYDAARLKGLDVRIDALPLDLESTTILGAASGDLMGDSAAGGDFDGDGIADLAIGSPHGDPLNRSNGGMIHIIHGREGRWPQQIDLANLPSSQSVRVSTILGAQGAKSGDLGDMLGYSTASADLDGDRRIDLITSEMIGNGLASGTVDVGNLVVVAGALFARDDVKVKIQTGLQRNGIPSIHLGGQRAISAILFGSLKMDINTIHVDSLRLGPGRAGPLAHRFRHRRVHDVNRDGFPDLIIRFLTEELGLMPGDTQLCLVGLAQGRAFRACMRVRTVAAALKSGRQ